MSLARRWWHSLIGLRPVPLRDRCSFCAKPSVELRYRPIFDDPGGQPAYEEIRRCADHVEQTA